MISKEQIAELERDVVIAQLDLLISLAEARSNTYDMNKLQSIKEYVLNWELC
jgi:hypothetical protein